MSISTSGEWPRVRELGQRAGEGKGKVFQEIYPVCDHAPSAPNPRAWEESPKRGSKGQGGKSRQKCERIKATKGDLMKLYPGIKNNSNEVNEGSPVDSTWRFRPDRDL